VTRLVNATPETDKRNTVHETPIARTRSDKKKSARIERDPSDEQILEFLRIALEQLKRKDKEQKHNGLFGKKNKNKEHEVGLDGLYVRGRTLAGLSAAAATSD